MSGGRGDPLGAFATSGIGPGPHLDFAQFWDLRANQLGLCCVRWWAVPPLLGHQTPGTGSHLKATGLCVVVGLALSCHRTAIREAFRSLYRSFSNAHFRDTRIYPPGEQKMLLGLRTWDLELPFEAVLPFEAMLPFEAVVAEQLLAEGQRIFASGPALPTPLAAPAAVPAALR